MTMRVKIFIAVAVAGAVVSLNRPPVPKAVSIAKPVLLVRTRPTKPVWRKKGKMSQVTLTSTPASFDFNVNPAEVTFPIPANFTISSANWILSWTPAVPPERGIISTGLVVVNNIFTPIDSGPSVDTVAASAAQIADMQASAGANLPVFVEREHGSQNASCSAFQLVLTGNYPPGFLKANFGNGLIHRPMQNNAGIHQFLNVTWPNGYLGGSVDVLKLMGNMNVFYTSLKLHGGGLCYLNNGVLVVTDGSGNELADGAPCDGVDIWRIGM